MWLTLLFIGIIISLIILFCLGGAIERSAELVQSGPVRTECSNAQTGRTSGRQKHTDSRSGIWPCAGDKRVSWACECNWGASERRGGVTGGARFAHKWHKCNDDLSTHFWSCCICGVPSTPYHSHDYDYCCKCTVGSCSIGSPDHGSSLIRSTVEQVFAFCFFFCFFNRYRN